MRRCARLDVPGSTRRLAIRCLVLAFRINHHVDAGRPHFQFLFTNSYEMPSANLSVRPASRQPRHTAHLQAAQAAFLAKAGLPARPRTGGAARQRYRECHPSSHAETLVLSAGSRPCYATNSTYAGARTDGLAGWPVHAVTPAREQNA